MKSVKVESKEPIITYPCLRAKEASRSGELIYVYLFRNNDSGVIVWSFSGNDMLGEEAAWKAKDCVPFNGSLTLNS